MGHRCKRTRPTRHLGFGGRGARKEEEDEERQDIRDTYAMAGASLGVECSLRGQRQMKGHSVAVPVRRGRYPFVEHSWVLRSAGILGARSFGPGGGAKRWAAGEPGEER